MEPLNPEDPDSDLVRRVWAIRKAADDSNFDAKILAEVRAELASYSEQELKDLAGSHFMFNDTAPKALMETICLRQRLAAELLGKKA